MEQNKNSLPASEAGGVPAILHKIVTGISKINEMVGRILSWTLAALTLLIFVEVLRRYVFHAPSIWGYDVSLWLFGMPALLGGGYVVLEKGHVNMDILYSKFPLRVRAIIDVFTSVMFFSFVIVLLVYGWKYWMSAIATNEVTISSWQVLVWPMKTCVPLSAFLLLLQGLAKLISDLYTAITGRELK